jgi:hypothetical protein
MGQQNMRTLCRSPLMGETGELGIEIKVNVERLPTCAALSLGQIVVSWSFGLRSSALYLVVHLFMFHHSWKDAPRRVSTTSILCTYD